MKMIYTFTLLQIINVILNTAKVLIMARTDNKHVSALINAVTYGFYVAVVQQIAKLDLTLTIIVTIVTNVIGVYLTYWIADKLKKDNLWKIEVYMENPECLNDFFLWLVENKISYSEITDNVTLVYAYTQAESHLIREWIERHKEIKTNNLKYNVTEIIRQL